MIVRGKNRPMVAPWRRAALVLTTAGLAATSAACTRPGQDRDAAAATVRALFTAVAAGDGEAACATLTPDTVAELEESSGTTCAQAITEEDLPEPGPVRTVDVYGQWARVVTSNDTVFLGAFGGGWRVVAAGCRSRGERPYDCRLQGA
jgi:ketosteroid isomerase-like protein